MNKIVIVVLIGTFLTGCNFFENRAVRDYEEAARVWNTGDYTGAVRKYLGLAKEYPRSSKADDALYWAGVTEFLYIGNTEKGLETLRLLLKRYPDRETASEAQWYIAQIYELGYNNYDQAIEEYGAAAGYSDPKIREKSLYSLADCLFRTGKIDEAMDTWVRQATEFPDGPNAKLAYYRLGTTAFAKGDLVDAENFYRRAIENNDDEELVIKAKLALAGCLEAGDDRAEALKLYKELQPLYPNKEAIDIKIRALEKRIVKKSY